MSPPNHRWQEIWLDREGRDVFEYLRGSGPGHRMSTDRAGTIVLLIESIAEQFRDGATQFKSPDSSEDTITYELSEGHRPITRHVAPETLETALRLGLLRPAIVYDGYTQTQPKQFGRRRLYDFGDTAKKYLDMGKLRSTVVEGDVDYAGDPNEGIIHRYMTWLTRRRYELQGFRVRTYVPAGSLSNQHEEVKGIDGQVLDVVAFDGESKQIRATAEIETRPVESDRVARDARLMACFDGDSDWVVPRKQDVARLLESLTKAGALTLPEGHPGWHKDLAVNLSMERLERIKRQNGVAGLLSPVVSSVTTGSKLHDQVQWTSDITWVGSE